MRALLLALTLAPATAFAWPIYLSGTVDVVALGMSIDTELELRRNNTGTAELDVLGVAQTVPLRWMRDPAGRVLIELPGVATLTGTPRAGCITGANTQPTPTFLAPFYGGPTIALAWDLCVAP